MSKYSEFAPLDNLSYWAEFVGIGLHAANVIEKNASMITPIELDRAIGYLQYAQSTGTGDNRQMIDQLNKLRSKFKR